jgi:4a-hydroxytetrahydrobiopterin dehydratase
MSTASYAPQPAFSSNYDPAQGTQDLAPLLKGNGGKWVLIESGKGVERGFKFKTFKKTWVRSFCSYFLAPFSLALA